jgi:hypothetical protein
VARGEESRSKWPGRRGHLGSERAGQFNGFLRAAIAKPPGEMRARASALRRTRMLPWERSDRRGPRRWGSRAVSSDLQLKKESWDAARDSPQMLGAGERRCQGEFPGAVYLRGGQSAPPLVADGNSLVKPESEMRPLRAGVTSCCLVGGGVGTVMMSRLASVHGQGGGYARCLPVAYFSLLGLLATLVCSLCFVAVFGSPGRKGWALAVLCVLLNRPVPSVPTEAGADEAKRNDQIEPGQRSSDAGNDLDGLEGKSTRSSSDPGVASR